MHIMHVIGARPNFMKAAPVVRALATYAGIRQSIVHTGQHYDFSMSDVFFQQLGIAAPDMNLAVGSGTHAQQTADVIRRFEPVLLERQPDLVLVYGDVNSTLAAALVCAKLEISVGHVEAGLRSFDRTMPEEINRLLTDQLSDLLFTPSEDANNNLTREGIAPEKVFFVGNVMIDTLIRMLPEAGRRLSAEIPEHYALVTLHRPGNVDDLPWLAAMLRALNDIGQSLPILFPVHPRTRQRVTEAGLNCVSNDQLRMLDPLSYVDFLGLQTRATVVITDSGGVQEETTFLGIPCLTVRENTERPVTVVKGTNILVGRNIDRIRFEVERILSGCTKNGSTPPLWDGHAAERIAEVVTSHRRAS
jgi:UDP-N-acetylglucosamine 2-epimerase (non-hydrolysing)